MAVLVIRRGERKGERIALSESQQLIIGRHPEKCNFVLDVPHVSRVHAKIWCEGENWYLEDERSHNLTHLDNVVITGKGPQLLNDGARITICNVEFEFVGVERVVEIEAVSSSTIEATVQQDSDQILEIQPAAKLKLLLDITTELARTLDADQILSRIVETLLDVFKKGDHAFLILAENGQESFKPAIVRARNHDPKISIRFSPSIVRTCLSTGNGYLCQDTTYLPENVAREGLTTSVIRSFMCAPLRSANQQHSFGVLQLDSQDPDSLFTEEDLGFLMAVAGQAAIALERAKMHEQTLAAVELERDLQLARQIQRSFLPGSAPRITGYEFAAFYQTAREVGGDYYDFIPLSNNRLAVLIGDVAGKGISAALLMAKISSAAQYVVQAIDSPSQILSRLNSVACEMKIFDKFITLVAARLDPATHVVTFANAGHGLPLVYHRQKSRVERAIPVTCSGLPLGVKPTATYTETSVGLDPGDWVMLFSDGIIDARNAKDESFREKGIIKALKEPHLAPITAIERLLAAVEMHSKGCRQCDDITVVCFGRTNE